MALRISEWILSTSLIAILATFFLISKLQSSRLSENFEFAPQYVHLAVTGAVEKPGILEVERGIALGLALKKAKPHRYANLRGIDLETPVTESGEICLQALDHLTIQLRGQEVEVPLGTRVCDLKKYLADSDRENAAKLTSRRLVKDGEKVAFSGE